MRCLLLYFLFGTTFSYTQTRHDPMDSLYETKWYLNLIELCEFGSNDTSNSIVTPVYGMKYVIFSDQLIYGSNSSYGYQQEDEIQKDPYHLIAYNGNRQYGDLYTFDTKRDFRKRIYGDEFYIAVESDELRLTSTGESSENLVTGVSESRIYYFSRTWDSLQLKSTILGSWKFDNQLKSMNFEMTDTLILTKTNRSNFTDSSAQIVFQYDHGASKFCHNIDIPEKKNIQYGIAPDPYYVSHRGKSQTFPYSINLKKQQLTLQSNFGSFTFNIIEISETKMILVKI